MRTKAMAELLCLLSVSAFAACQPAPSVDVASTQSPVPLPPPQAPQAARAKAVQPKKTAKSPAGSTTEQRAAAAVVTANTQVESRQEPEELTIATTISGCLVRDGEVFQLKDTDGEHAPRSRSWKSGFIKKGSARIDLVDASHRLRLDSHVGHRVTVSGMLTDREMHARSIRPTMDRCD